MNLITREELKQKIDNGDDFKLVMVLGEWAYRAKHIPGSLNVTSPAQGVEMLDPNDDIVVYCSNPSCVASQAAYRILEDRGYKRIQRYAGGIVDWEEAGLPMEGDMVGDVAAI